MNSILRTTVVVSTLTAVLMGCSDTTAVTQSSRAKPSPSSPVQIAHNDKALSIYFAALPRFPDTEPVLWQTAGGIPQVSSTGLPDKRLNSEIDKIIEATEIASSKLVGDIQFGHQAFFGLTATAAFTSSSSKVFSSLLTETIRLAGGEELDVIWLPVNIDARTDSQILFSQLFSDKDRMAEDAISSYVQAVLLRPGTSVGNVCAKLLDDCRDQLTPTTFDYSMFALSPKGIIFGQPLLLGPAGGSTTALVPWSLIRNLLTAYGAGLEAGIETPASFAAPPLVSANG